MKKIVIIGAGGFGKEIAWLIERINSISQTYSILGFLDDNVAIGTPIGKYSVLGTIDYLKSAGSLSVTVAVGNSIVRRSIIKKIKDMNLNLKFPNLIDPSVLLGPYIEMGVGNIICAGSILTTEYSLGDYDIINLDCTIGHEAILKDFITLYPSVNVSGKVEINSISEIGTGSQIIQGLNIGKNVIAGAGSVIVKDVPDNVTIVGSPAKVIKKREDI